MLYFFPPYSILLFSFLYLSYRTLNIMNTFLVFTVRWSKIGSVEKTSLRSTRSEESTPFWDKRLGMTFRSFSRIICFTFDPVRLLGETRDSVFLEVKNSSLASSTLIHVCLGMNIWMKIAVLPDPTCHKQSAYTAVYPYPGPVTETAGAGGGPVLLAFHLVVLKLILHKLQFRF